MAIKDTYQLLLESVNKIDRKNITIYVGMSGGVDSSVTAYLLKEAGFNVKGIYMQCWGRNDPKCRSHKDRSDAVKVASHLGIPFEVWDLEDSYKEKVIDYFYEEYQNGRTPNPDILCNSKIKFDLFLNKAIEDGADFVATGHYAKIVVNDFGVSSFQFPITNQAPKTNNQRSNKNSIFSPEESSHNSKNLQIQGTNYNIQNTLFIASGYDMLKDQSYFLSRVKSSSLSKIIFPLSSVIKSSKNGLESTRKLAANLGIPVADKKDSTGICFLEGVDVQDFLKERLKEKKGDVLNINGEIIGYHKGAWFFTVGQRRGFEIMKYQGNPMYVLSKKVDENTITVGEKKDLKKNDLLVKDYSLSLPTEVFKELVQKKELYVRIRNLGEFVPISNISIRKKELNIDLGKSIEAVAEGQFAVIYWFDTSSNERLIVCSGIIS